MLSFFCLTQGLELQNDRRARTPLYNAGMAPIPFPTPCPNNRVSLEFFQDNFSAAPAVFASFTHSP